MMKELLRPYWAAVTINVFNAGAVMLLIPDSFWFSCGIILANILGVFLKSLSAFIAVCLSFWMGSVALAVWGNSSISTPAILALSVYGFTSLAISYFSFQMEHSHTDYQAKLEAYKILHTEEREQLQLVIDSIPGFLVNFDSHLVVTSSSKSASQMFEHLFDPNKAIESATNPLTKLISEFHASSESTITKEMLLPLSQGDSWFLISLFKSRTPDLRIIAVGLPINDLMNTRVELVVQMSKLIKATKLASLGELAASVAHEINNPIAILYAYATEMKHLMQKDNPDKELKILDRLDKQSKTIFRIKKIVSSMRLLSREAERDPFETSDLAPIVEDTLNLCQQKYSQNGVTLVVEPPPPLSLNCRPTQVSQVLLNLLNNAFDAVREHVSETKVVEVKFKQEADKLLIIVKDNGPGIPEDIKEKIFAPFFTTKVAGQGTGLGLSISRTILDEHKGKLSCQSKPGETSFIVEIPLGEAVKKEAA